GIEAVPTEPQDDATDGAEREVVRRHRAAAVLLELPSEARSQHDAPGERDHTAHGVHDRRAGEVAEDDTTVVVDEPREPTHRVAQPAAGSPRPVPEDGVDEAGHEDAVDDLALEAGAT